jgi:hypothetical protein
MVFSCLTPAQFHRYSSFHLCQPVPPVGDALGSERQRNLIGKRHGGLSFCDSDRENKLGKMPALPDRLLKE